MCGVFGIFNSTATFSADTIRRYTDTLIHRGPDNGNVFIAQHQKMALGHRRLSIIDLSEQANQPFFSQCGRYVMVYNGEIYNFKQLAKTLPKTLQTHSDTEVLLEGFVQYGVDFITKLNGMFAFAIYDIKQDTLLLARDRVGIKPLFYYWDNEILIFASEIKAIQAVKPDLSIQRSVLPYFLHLGYIPEPYTIYQNVFKFKAGYYAIFNQKQLSFYPYWKVEQEISDKCITNEQDAIHRLDTLLHRSVRSQLVSDVPLGVFLSGGVDSSTIAAIAAHNTDKPIKTFSIAFTEADFNESKYAEEVAKHIRSEHYSLTFNKEDIFELFERYHSAYDEPCADSSLLPTMMVSKLAREYVTVALSGDGGDELFLGYGAYQWAGRLQKTWLKAIRPVLYAAAQLGNDRYKRIGRLLRYSSKNRLKSHIFSQEHYFFSELELTKLLVQPIFDFSPINQDKVVHTRKVDPIEHQSLFDFQYYLRDDLLVKIDRASMQFSLETRVPFLDNELIRFAWNVPTSLKIKNKQNKYILRQVLYRYVPRSIFERPKWGFSVPIREWLTADLKHWMDTYLSKQVIQKHNIIHYDAAQYWVKRFLKGEKSVFNKVWVMIVLHQWLER
ncbi:MAG: asparagine synthase (glutamine-hydrolyzing) [Bacteroidia bacterium]|nr:asparagine synthase (glutamine-hydrolyzing) [Bacteroidia bacterium]MDW8346692.1 asparagine synthase (glutamine-hydrolyzing) [Bacteroidia bacterium]